MRPCKICKNNTETIISFDKTPVANGFIDNPNQKEYFFELSTVFCPKCYMVQLGDVPKPEVMFNPNYAFMSMTSTVMADHFKKVADEIIETTKGKKDPFIVELGSNDGIMLQHVKEAHLKHLGVEPAKNVAQLAEEKGITVLNKFFGSQVAQEIVKNHGHADIIFSANSLLSVEELNDTFEGFANLLSNDGVLIFEDPYIYDIVKLVSFDQIYDEHIYFFSGLSVTELGARHGLQLVDMKHQETHGGSMRYYLKKGKNNMVNARVTDCIKREKAAHLDRIEGYMNFRDGVNKVCSNLKITLQKLKKEGKSIAGYGATSKSTTLLNYAGIGPDLVAYISDNTPTKIGKYTPGMHIPVKDRAYFLDNPPDYTLLFAWNHKKEIMAKEQTYRNNGGKFITYFPTVTIE